MKRICLILIVLASYGTLGSCQEGLELEIDLQIPEKEDTEVVKPDIRPRYEEIMSLGGNTSPWAQGGDSWGDYFFQFVSDNSLVRIYDLSTKTLVQSLRIPTTERGFVPNCHCNTVCFGTEYYDAEDIFPLIYVSTGYESGGYTGALVYRITLHQEVFFITLVQTIKFPAENSSWTEFVPGDGYAYLCYTSERVIYKVEMPKLKDGDIIIGRDSALETYQFPPQPDWMSTSRNQDRVFYQGEIMFVSGGPGEAIVFVVLDLKNRERKTIVDLTKIGLKNEPESIFIWQGDLCIAFLDRIVRLIL